MATKKQSRRSRKNSGPRADLGDPPILVGGGGSSYLWVHLAQEQRPVNPSLDNPGIGIKPGAPKPHTRDNYICSRVKDNYSKVTFDDGTNPPTILNIAANNVIWSVKFE
jgi:hypothetical protein